MVFEASPKGIVTLIEDILDYVGSLDHRISTKHLRYGDLLTGRYPEGSIIRQILPGQSELGWPIEIGAYRTISYNLDLTGGNSETIITSLIMQVRVRLANLDYIKADFFIYGDPIYQGKGIYAIQWGLAVTIPYPTEHSGVQGITGITT